MLLVEDAPMQSEPTAAVLQAPATLSGLELLASTRTTDDSRTWLWTALNLVRCSHDLAAAIHEQTVTIVNGPGGAPSVEAWKGRLAELSTAMEAGLAAHRELAETAVSTSLRTSASCSRPRSSTPDEELTS